MAWPANRINYKRFFLGGFVAGLILLFGGVLLAHGVFGEEYSQRFRSKMAAAPSGWTIVYHSSVRIGFGLIVAFLYAAFRPRFGPGPKTALIAGFLLWVSAYLPLTLALVDFGILEGWRLWLGLFWGLAEACLAAIAAGWIYKED